MIEPVIDALTTSILPVWRAKNAMMSSVAFPKVALRRPPPPSRCGRRAPPSPDP
jgi:hypothetical protein